MALLPPVPLRRCISRPVRGGWESPCALPVTHWHVLCGYCWFRPADRLLLLVAVGISTFSQLPKPRSAPVQGWFVGGFFFGFWGLFFCQIHSHALGFFGSSARVAKRTAAADVLN